MTTFALELGPDGSVRFSDGRVALIRCHPGWQWEFYLIVQRGPCRGLERFVRHLRAEEATRVEHALECELARRRLTTRGIDERSVAARLNAGLCVRTERVLP